MSSQSSGEVVNEVLLKALNAVEKGGDFVVTQAPDVVQQLLTWTLVSSCVWAVLGLLAAVLGYRMLVWASKNQYDDASGAAAVSGAVLVAAGLMGALVYATEALKVWLAPKIFLIEYTASLVK